MLKFTSIVFLFFVSFHSFAQPKKQMNISFNAIYNNANVNFDSTNYLLQNNTDSVSFSTLKFYVSNVILLNNGKKVFQEKNSYHLINFIDSFNKDFKLNIPKKLIYNQIQFNLGVDSLTNSKGVFTNDLDPIKGMYWAWHSGYINFKLEGTSKVCKTRNNIFQFHLGGFLNGFNAYKKILLKTNNTNEIKIKFDINNFINNVDIATTNEIMTPSKKAVELSEVASKCFKINN